MPVPSSVKDTRTALPIRAGRPNEPRPGTSPIVMWMFLAPASTEFWNSSRKNANGQSEKPSVRCLM